MLLNNLITSTNEEMPLNVESLLPWCSAICALLLLLFKLFKSRNKSSKLLPPGPVGWPIIGNLFDLGDVPHETLHNLKLKYGPIIHLKLGSINTIVVQSEKAASELFKKHDLSFVDRKTPDSLTALDYHKSSLPMGAYTDYLKQIRRICTTEFLVHKRVNATVSIRRKCVDDLIERIKIDTEMNGEISLNRLLYVMSFDVIGNLILSKEVMESFSENASEFFDLFKLFTSWAAKPNIVDLYPFLRWVDPQGIRRNSGKYFGRLLEIVSGIVKERMRDKESGVVKDTHDLLDTLLEDEGDEKCGKLTEKNITIILLEMFFAGTDTTGNTVEWGMSELLRNPHILHKLQQEIDRVVGRTRKVEENDLNNLPYLHATVKEILRLYPIFPMLLPRRAVEDTEFMGYVVPKDAQILVNAWAIHRDPASWPDPLSFKPERFLESDIDYKGQHFELLPFGSGRRYCLGITLGYRMVSLTIASLLQSFDWKLGDGIGPEEVDMRGTLGITMRKLVPLKVIPTVRA